MVDDLSQCPRTVAEVVFHLAAKAGETRVVAIGDKQRVISESAIALSHSQNAALDSAGEVGDFDAVSCQYHGAFEARASVDVLLHFAQQAVVVARVVALDSTEARRPDAGCAVERINFKAGIVGKHPTIDPRADAKRLEAGVFQKSGAGFLDFREILEFRGIEDLEAPFEHGSHFGGFVGIAGGENQSFGRGHVAAEMRFFFMVCQFF